MPRTRALVSIHDVTPDRLERVLEIARLLDDAGVPPAILLVVPGLEWRAEEVAQLRALTERGYELAGHGWIHRAPPPRSLWHRLHGAVLSRDQAEHLSRDRDELVAMVAGCHAWFSSVDLPAPDVYVPPAWALGALTLDDLCALPFTWYECLPGFLAPRTRARRALPLVGFEGDTVGRELGLHAWNGLNRAAAALLQRPVRVSIHPHDLELRLGDALRRLIRSQALVFEKTGDWLARELALPAPAEAVERVGP